MTLRELDVWYQYRFKYGPLNPVRMYDQGAAITASQINNAHGGKARPLDFMPYGKIKEAEPELDTEEFIAALMRTGRAKMGR